MRILLWLTLLSALFGCQTWDGGIPPSGKGMTNDEKVKTYGQFAISGIGPSYIYVRKGKSDEAYQRYSFEPVFNSLSPDLAPRFTRLEHYTTWTAVLAGIAGGALAYLSREHLRKEDKYMAYGVFGISFLGQRFTSFRFTQLRDESFKFYADRLDDRVFGDGK